MRRRAVFTMGVILCFCMLLSLSMQAALADIDDPFNAPVRIHRKELKVATTRRITRTRWPATGSVYRVPFLPRPSVP